MMNITKRYKQCPPKTIKNPVSWKKTIAKENNTVPKVIKPNFTNVPEVYSLEM